MMNLGSTSYTEFGPGQEGAPILIRFQVRQVPLSAAPTATLAEHTPAPAQVGDMMETKWLMRVTC